MSITRRHFLLGTSAGLILPTFFDKAWSYFENHGEPLLVTPRKHDEILYAVDLAGSRRDGFEFLLGAPLDDFPTMTLGEFIELQYDSVKHYLLEYEGYDPEDIEEAERELDLDEHLEDDMVLDFLPKENWPEGRAYEYLSDLDLGPRLESAKAAGELRFIDERLGGSGYLGVHADNAVTLSLLQMRLNELGERIAIKLS